MEEFEQPNFCALKLENVKQGSTKEEWNGGKKNGKSSKTSFFYLYILYSISCTSLMLFSSSGSVQERRCVKKISR